MNLSRPTTLIILAAFFVCGSFARSSAQAQESFRIAYGGYNETAGPMWIGIEKGFFRSEHSGSFFCLRFVCPLVGASAGELSYRLWRLQRDRRTDVDWDRNRFLQI